MYFSDFEYDGYYLSDYGFIVCSFDGSGSVNEITAGAALTFTKVKKSNGKNYSLVSSQYEECFSTTIYVCKDPCAYSDEDIFITDDEYRDISRWLNRKEYLKFQAINPEGNDTVCYYNASFNIEKVVLDGDLVGLKLSMETDSPYGYGNRVEETFDITDPSQKYIFLDVSDEIGQSPIDVTITCTSSGNIELFNETLNRKTIVSNCSAGETITIRSNVQTLESSIKEHNLYDDFNYVFPKIMNSLSDTKNVLSVNIACKLSVGYTPVVRSLI